MCWSGHRGRRGEALLSVEERSQASTTGSGETRLRRGRRGAAAVVRAEVGLVGNLHGGDEELIGAGRGGEGRGNGGACQRRLSGGRRWRSHGSLPHGGDGGRALHGNSRRKAFPSRGDFGSHVRTEEGDDRSWSNFALTAPVRRM